MLFTLVIWVISALSLIISCILYLVFLAHYIDGNLSSYCRRKIDKRLEKIVGVKIQKALQKQADARKKAEDKVIALEKPSPGFGLDMKTKAHNVTVKDLGYLDLPLSRRTTETSITTTGQPAHRPTRQERLAQQQSCADSITGEIRPGAPTRTATQTSQATSIESDTRPLLHQAASMGQIPAIRTMSNQSSQSQLRQAYNKPLPMPGAFDPLDSSDDDLSSFPQQSYTIPLDTFDLKHMPARPESAQSNYSDFPSHRPVPARMPSLRDFATNTAYTCSRQTSITSHVTPGHNREIETVDPAASLYSQPAVEMPAQPHYNDISRAYTPFGTEQSPAFYSYVQSQVPSRAATLPTAPRMPAPALTPPRRVGTAPPASVMRASPFSMPRQDMVYELDGGHGVDLQLRSDDEFGYGMGGGNGRNGNGIGDGLGGYRYP